MGREGEEGKGEGKVGDERGGEGGHHTQRGAATGAKFLRLFFSFFLREFLRISSFLISNYQARKQIQ